VASQTVQRLLITGIPGTGKTTLGHHLNTSRGYTHFDLEDRETLSRLTAPQSSFLYKVISTIGDVVVTWGFPVNDWAVTQVVLLRANGFHLVWFDGDRSIALKIFNRRGDVPEWLFHRQIASIESTKIIHRLQPRIVDPFGADGEIKPLELLAEAVLSKVAG
jgi:hypothetical protein